MMVHSGWVTFLGGKDKVPWQENMVVLSILPNLCTPSFK